MSKGILGGGRIELETQGGVPSKSQGPGRRIETSLRSLLIWGRRLNQVDEGREQKGRPERNRRPMLSYLGRSEAEETV